MSKTAIKLENLDGERQKILLDLALYCCESGEAPLYFYGTRSSNKRKQFDILMKAVAASGCDLGEPHPAYSTVEELATLVLIQNQVQSLHMNQLLDINKYLEEIEKRSPTLAKIITTTGDDAGLVSVDTMNPGDQWFEHNNKALFLVSILIQNSPFIAFEYSPVFVI